MSRPRIAILGSGQGTNMEAIAQARSNGALDADIAIALSDVEDAPILQRAERWGIPSRFVSPGPYRAKLDERAESEIIAAIRDAGADYVVLAGFMRILKGEFIRAFPERIVNIHPSLLPAFPGLSAWKQALDYGVHVTGCTVHLVDRGVDTGTILAQATVEALPDDTERTLHDRIQEQERQLYPRTIAKWVRGEFVIRGRRAACETTH